MSTAPHSLVNKSTAASTSASQGYKAFNKDGRPLAVVKSPYNKRLQQIQTVNDFAAILSEDVGDAIAAFISAAILLLTAYFLLRRVAARTGIPEVLLFLAAGMLVRLVSDPLEAAKFDVISKPIVRMALTAMGLQIGSHLNKAVIEPLFKPLVRFSLIFSPIVICISAATSFLLYPSLGAYSWLVGAIALERSSPEALHGIAAAKAAGPFTNATMSIAALQDVLALVAFVVFGAIVGQPLSHAVAHLAELTVGTCVATCVTVLGVRMAVSVPFIASLFISPADSSPTQTQLPITAREAISDTEAARNNDPEDPSTPIKVEPPALRARRLILLRILLAFLVLVTPLMSWFFHVELLLAAVLAGAVLNWDQQHRLTVALEEHSTLSNVLLFCLLGHRIQIIAYLQNLPYALVLFGARLFGLFLGAWAGGLAAPLHTTEDTAWHNRYRWMGLVTQLAIALSLVDRMEEGFPEAAAMARACGGSVIGGLLFGPSLLQFVLRKVGEIGRVTHTVHGHVGGTK